MLISVPYQRVCAAPPRLPAGDRLASLHVLVVDDDAGARDLVCAALRHFGVRDIRSAADAWTALADLDATHCDLLICDLDMPGIDGVELLHLAASRDVDAYAIMSGADAGILAAVEDTLAEHGAIVPGFLPKPLTLDAVRRLLHGLADVRAPLRAALPPPRTAPAPFDLLAGALDAREFVPFYQPKVSLDDGRTLGVEVLARWLRPDGSIGLPAGFIPAMESTTLIDRLSWQLIEQALGDASDWDRPLTMAFNLAPRTLEHPELPGRLAALACKYGIAPERIVLELTETTMAGRPGAVRDCVARLRLRGFGVAIDDFGTGYASLALLLDLPFTELKIDRRFVSRLAVSPKARTMLETMIALGKRLDMDIIAEGVETEQDLALLCALGCPAAQGFHIAHPQSATLLRDWIAGRK